jgi:His/Glu/Gln/Arg/opine family amino acid ABC transporter permease subunit
MLDLDVIWRNFPFLMLQGFLGFGNFVGGTLRLAIPSIVLGFLLGIFIGIARLAPQWWIRMPATVYVEFFRGVPLVMVIFWMWFIMPIVLKTSIPEFGVALTAFVVFEAAYLGEIVRAGIQSVARGQVEAATALGLSSSQGMRYVILPVALRLIIPPGTNESLSLLKNSSIALTISVAELTFQTRQIETYTAKAIEAFAAGTVIYLVLCVSIASIMSWVERHTAIPGLIVGGRQRR